ncbi:MAG: UvrD-helicase domain-containing protein [Ignavibacterium sp.]|nr:UvrD-helicase domain-containing protein [Ignavibacterium sp.]MDW8375783.1 UvrD-helicase domain-containing protein [Ignavibacteriales bacterium]
MSENKTLFTPHQIKAIESENHLALTANPGSGKTFVLKYKYLNIAKKLDGDISKIAAITFTNKAANELYEKISDLVDEEILKTTDLEQLKLLYKIRRNLVFSYISTIHSFCIELLKNYPIEAGIDANFQPIDQTMSDELIEICIEETIDNLYQDKSNSDLIKELIRFFGSRFKLKTELIKLLNNRKNLYIIFEQYSSKTDEELEKHINEEFYNKIKEIDEIFGSKFVSYLITINDIVRNSNPKNAIAQAVEEKINEYKSDKNFLKLLEGVSDLAFTDKGNVRSKSYLSSNLREEVINEINQLEDLFSKLSLFINSDKELSLHKDLVKLNRKILHLFKQIDELYQKKKLKNSYIDFDDILIKTKLILKNPKVRADLSERFKYLMVDEYQDTDQTQYEIFLPILDDLRKGNLFIVGDDKQSIYRFRDADPYVFEKTKSDILSYNQVAGLQFLPDSFRMNKEICLFTNFLFDKLFQESIPLFNEMKNVHLVCAADYKGVGEIEFLASIEDKQSPAEMTALKILELVHNQNYKFYQIAVLVRKRKFFDELENIFTLKKIPYKIIGGRGFFQRQIISDIRNYLAFISNLNDDISLIAILRSPFYMISDEELLEISQAKGKNFFEKLIEYSSRKDKYLIIVQKLNEHIKLCASLPISILIRKILSDTDYLFVIKNRHNGEQEIANIEKLISFAREFEEAGFKTLFDFIKYLDESKEKKSDEPQAEGLLSDFGVQLMTIHQAKGLEFPVVFLYRCEATPDNSSNKAKEITISKDYGLLLQIKKEDNPFSDFYKPPILLLNDFIESARDLAETKRLLYVGITRAQEKLFFTYEHKAQGNYNHRSFIKLILDHIQIKEDNSFEIEDDLTLLLKNENNFVNSTQRVKAKIVSRTFVEEKNISPLNNEHKIEKYLIDTRKIESEIQNQIISATKISTFEKCPLKYHLTYNIGLAKLLKLLPNKAIDKQNPEFLIDEIQQDSIDEISLDNLILNYKSSDKIGRIVHKILERNLSFEKVLESFKDKNTFKLSSENLSSEEEIILLDLLKRYFNSDLFKEITKYENFKNEFEILVKENNLILKGIIDKIIFADDKVLIIDFKSDILSPAELENRYEEYQSQMKFYLYISMKFFENIDNFESRLVFLRYPEKNFKLFFNRGEIDKLKNDIYPLINGILENNQNKNLEHCKNCIYSISNSQCIIK